MILIRPNGITFDDVLLVPRKSSVESRNDIDLSAHLTPNIILKTPIVSSNMDTVTESTMAKEMARLGGIGIIHRFLDIEHEANEVALVKKEKLLVGAAIGIKEGYLERTAALIKAGADVIVIDIAHGHSSFLIKVLQTLREKYPKFEFIAGNVATAEATEELIANGASAIKVGIGPGALCSTRIIAGAGVPQVTAIMDCASVALKHHIPLIADGGIRYSGDIVKALAAGASTVMIGSMIAGCEESPALVVEKDNQKFKITRGMASLAANRDRKEKDGKVRMDLRAYAAEGVEALVPYRGAVKEVIEKLAGGTKSGFSYSGSTTLEELWKKAEFVQISNSALIESHPHDVIKF